MVVDDGVVDDVDDYVRPDIAGALDAQLYPRSSEAVGGHGAQTDQCGSALSRSEAVAVVRVQAGVPLG